MCSALDDRTARAVIRDEALRLFGAHGPDAVSVRKVAAAAGVSPGLVIHHFGTKDGLRAAVDAHVLAQFTGMLGELTGESDLYAPRAAGSLTEVFARYLPAGSPMPDYLRRLLLEGGETGLRLFSQLYQASRVAMDAMVTAGMAVPGTDPAVRAAILLCNDLVVLLLREQIALVLGEDPLSPAGLARWGNELLTIYAAGLLGQPPGEERG